MDPEANTDDYDVTSDLTDGGAHDSVPSSGGEGTTSTPDDAVNVNLVEQEPKQEDLSLRDQLSNAFKGGEDNTADDKENKGGEQNAAEAPKEGTQEKPELTKDAEGRYRKLDGTFASAEEVQAFESANTQQTNAHEDIIATLPANVAEQIKSLPEETQQFVARTMEDLNNRASRYSEYDQLESIIGPRREAWAQEGMNPVVAINSLVALSDFAGSNPKDFVFWFADQHNIDLDAALDERYNSEQNVSPEVRELRSQVTQLSQTLQQLQQGNAAPAQPSVDQNQQAVQAFVNEKDENGNLKRPYLSDVMPSFAAQVSAVRAANPSMSNQDVLAKAYENACWADPNVRLKLQAEMDAERRQAARQKVEAKRNASSGIRGGPSSGSGLNPGQSSGDLSLRDELRRQFAAHGA